MKFIQYLIFYSFLLLSTKTFGQVFVYCDSLVYNGYPGSYSFGLFDVSTCRDSNIAVTTTSDIQDVTYSDNGRVYTYTIGVGAGGTIFPPGIYRAGRNLTSLAFWGSISEQVTALGCDGNGLIYAAGKGLSTFDVVTGQSRYIGDFPASMEAAGDLTFRDGKLYLSTISNTLLEVDVENPRNSTVFMNFPAGTPPVQGLATFPYSCDSIKTYAIAVGTGGSTIYEIDFDNKTLIELCQSTRWIIGAASEMECFPNFCSLYIDLDKNDSSGATGYDYRSDTVCYASFFAFDVDIDITAEESIDSITVHLSNPIDIGQENFILSTTANVLIEGAGTSHLKIINMGGNSTIQDFEKAVSSVVYNNMSPAFSYGDREIWVRAYSRNFSSKLATSRLILKNRLNLKTTITPVSCYKSKDGTIALNLTGNISPTRYRWDDGNTEINRNQLQAGSYIVTISDHVGCKIIDTLMISQPDSLRVNLQSNSDTVCGSSGQLQAKVSGGTMPYQFRWAASTTIIDSMLRNVNAGNYSVTVTDKNGCSASGAYHLVAGDTVRTQERRTLCKGERLEWNGQSITKDTSFCVAYRAAAGCDSLHCVEVRFLDSVLVQQSVTLCNKETYLFNGQLLNRDTSICATFSRANGCDSTLCLTLRFQKRVQNIAATICAGATYAFAGKNLSAAGIYSDTIRSGGTCDSVIILNLQVAPMPQVSITPNGSLCEGGNLKLEVPAGFSKYQWSNGAVTAFTEVKNPGNYAVTVTSAQGCTDTALITIANTSFQPVVRGTNPTCFGKKDGSIIIDTVLGGNPPYTYKINNQRAQSVNRFNQLFGGIYQLRIEDENGCFVTTSLTLTEPEALTLNVGDDTTLPLGDSLVLTAQTNAVAPKLRWKPPIGLSCDTCVVTIAKPLQSIRYEVVVTDSSGCVAKDELAILINRQQGVYVPNAFSPNGDGVNDVLTVFTDQSVQKITYFRIFDRWGNLVYEGKDLAPGDTQQGWDGTFGGKVVADGVYVYAVGVEMIDGTITPLQGEVLLLK